MIRYAWGFKSNMERQDTVKTSKCAQNKLKNSEFLFILCLNNKNRMKMYVAK